MNKATKTSIYFTPEDQANSTLIKAYIQHKQREAGLVVTDVPLAEVIRFAQMITVKFIKEQQS